MSLPDVVTGWPVPPSREEWCHTCPAGWATTSTDQDHCTMCTPGTYAERAQSPACLQCGNGTYTDSWGSSNCYHCIIGTFAPYQVDPPPPSPNPIPPDTSMDDRLNHLRMWMQLDFSAWHSGPLLTAYS